MPNRLYKLFNRYGDITRFDEPLAKYTSFKIGGPAEVLITPENISQLKKIYQLALRENIAIHILGGGTNLLIRDEGIRGVVIKPDLRDLRLPTSGSGNNTVLVGAGYPLAHLVTKCIQSGLGGLESLAGIPGTLGGAVIMNTGGKYGTIGDCVKSVRIINSNSEEQVLSAPEFQDGYCTATPLLGADINEFLGWLSKSRFSYSVSGLNKVVLLEIILGLTESDPEELKRRFQDILSEKSTTQPLSEKSAGCVFRNPGEESAGQLIEKAGLKGLSIGQARVSEKHANFIINTGNATAHDVLTLIEKVKKTVQDKFGITLELEIEVW